MGKSTESLNVLLIGNNPIDLTKTLEKLNQFHGRRMVTEIAFDLRSIAERLLNFSPDFILIDDNIGRQELAQIVESLSRNKKTRDVPITILKNSNYHESTATGIMDYVLKNNFSAEAFHHTLRNSLKFKRTERLLRKAYERRKKQLGRLSISR